MTDKKDSLLSPGSDGALSSAMEDYLEAIYHLEQEHRIARVRDIAQRLRVKMSSVSSALKILGTKGLISYDPHQYITLTKKGIRAAKEIVRKHEILQRFLVSILKVDEGLAEDNACRIEHYLDRDVIERLVTFVEFIELCPAHRTRLCDGAPDSGEECAQCLVDAGKHALDRKAARKAALEVGVTLAEIQPGVTVVVDEVRGSERVSRSLSEEGVLSGAVIIVEEKDLSLGALTLNVKGYHVKVPMSEAACVHVKPA